MHWNYALIKIDEAWSVCEVYYDGEVVMAYNEVELTAEKIERIQDDLRTILLHLHDMPKYYLKDDGKLLLEAEAKNER